jgi:hypothetical protein
MPETSGTGQNMALLTDRNERSRKELAELEE